MSQRPHQAPASLDELMARAEGYANFAMRKIGHVPPALFADSPKGPLQFVPKSLADERAKNTFANTARLICAAYEVTAAVLVLEAWIKVAKPGEGSPPPHRNMVFSEEPTLGVQLGTKSADKRRGV